MYMRFCPRVPWQVHAHVCGGQRSILGVFLIGLCARVSVAVKAHYDCGNFYKGNHVIGVACSLELGGLGSMVLFKEVCHWG